MNLLDQLKTFTTVVADTGDFESIKKYKPQDATTNPSLILAAAKSEAYRPLINEVVKSAVGLGESVCDATVTDIVDDLFVAFGQKILEVIPGRVSTEVDARLSFDTDKTIARARGIIAKYRQLDIPKDRVLIKIASTWEGIQACRALEADGISCNMTLMFGLHQAVACADVGATLISPFVGRILDWHKKRSGRESYLAQEDPGVLSVWEIYNYYKYFDIETEVMGASFRNAEEILALAGCDLLTIAPKFLDELQNQQGELSAVLSKSASKAMTMSSLGAVASSIARPLSKSQFDALHQQNEMASEKLAEGIQSFCQASQSLEALILEMVSS